MATYDYDPEYKEDFVKLYNHLNSVSKRHSIPLEGIVNDIIMKHLKDY